MRGGKQKGNESAATMQKCIMMQTMKIGWVFGHVRRRATPGTARVDADTRTLPQLAPLCGGGSHEGEDQRERNHAHRPRGHRVPGEFPSAGFVPPGVIGWILPDKERRVRWCAESVPCTKTGPRSASRASGAMRRSDKDKIELLAFLPLPVLHKAVDCDIPVIKRRSQLS